MGICVIQDVNKLSKNQIQKIKEKVASFIENHNESDLLSFLNKEILPNIFPINSFNDISFQKNEHYEIYLKNVEKNDPRTVLRMKLKNQQMMRRSSDNPEPTVWKMYDMLKKHIRADIPVPSPLEIKKQIQMYSGLVDQIKDPTFKNYINQCLSLN